MSVKLINKVEKAKKRSSSVLNQFTETQEQLQQENVNLDEVKKQTKQQIEQHEQAIQGLLDIHDEATFEQENNAKSIDGINFILNGNN